MITIHVCIGSACHLKGSYQIIEKLEELIQKNDYNDKVLIKASFCLGHCTQAVSVKIDKDVYSVSPSTVEEFFNDTIREKVLSCK